MQHRPTRRVAAWLSAAVMCLTLTACGENPLESVGQRSTDWIGPVSDGVSFLSNDGPAEGAGSDDPIAGPVSVSEGDG